MGKMPIPPIFYSFTFLLLIRYGLYSAIRLIVQQYEAIVLHTAIGDALELQRSLQRSVCILLLCAFKLSAILVDATNEELRLIVASEGEAWKSLTHVRLEPLAVAALQVGGQERTRCKRMPWGCTPRTYNNSPDIHAYTSTTRCSRRVLSEHSGTWHAERSA